YSAPGLWIVCESAEIAGEHPALDWVRYQHGKMGNGNRPTKLRELLRLHDRLQAGTLSSSRPVLEQAYGDRVGRVSQCAEVNPPHTLRPVQGGGLRGGVC